MARFEPGELVRVKLESFTAPLLEHLNGQMGIVLPTKEYEALTMVKLIATGKEVLFSDCRLERPD